MTAPDTPSPATRPEIPDLAAYAELTGGLLPSSGYVMIFDVRGDLVWSSGKFERPDLHELIDAFRAQAHAVACNRGSIRRTADGIAALLARLADATGGDLGFALIELGSAHSVDDATAVRLTRPLLDLLSAHLASPRLQRGGRSGAGDLLLQMAEVDPSAPDAVRQLLALCVTELRLVSAAFSIPSQGLTIVAAHDESGAARRNNGGPARRNDYGAAVRDDYGTAKHHASGAAERLLRDSTRRHLLAWAQLNDKPMIVNKAGGDQARARFKILTCPVAGSGGRPGGLLVLFRAAQGEDFGLIDLQLAGFVTRQALAVMHERQDPATGLASVPTCERAIEDCLAARRTGSLLHIAIDNLTAIDDRFGSAVGDAIVERVAELIRHRLGPADSACRLADGGFIILLADRAGPAALRLARELEDRVARMDYRSAGAPVAVAVRCGASEPPPGKTGSRRWIAAARAASGKPGVAGTSKTYNGAVTV